MKSVYCFLLNSSEDMSTQPLGWYYSKGIGLTGHKGFLSPDFMKCIKHTRVKYKNNMQQLHLNERLTK